MLRVPGRETDLFSVKAARRRRAHRLLAARCRRDSRGRTPTGKWSSSPSGSRRPRRPTPWPCSRRRSAGLPNFSLLVSHVLVPPAMEAILSSPRQPRAGVPGRRPRLHGHGLSPSTSRSRRSTACPSSSPASSRSTSCRASTCASSSSKTGAPRSRTSTRGAVRREGNLPAQAARARRCSRWCTRKWRGIGEIPASGLGLRPALSRLRRRDALRRRQLIRAEEPAECISGRGPAGHGEAARVPGLRHALHAGAPARRAPWSPPRAPAPRTIAIAASAESGSEELRSWNGRFPAHRCPAAPHPAVPHVLLAHGGGGRLTHQLIEQVFLPAFAQSRRSARGTTAPVAADAGRRSAWPSPPTPTWSARCSSPAATSARWPSTAR